MLKRVLVFLTVLSLALPFAGCGPSPEAPSSVEATPNTSSLNSETSDLSTPSEGDGAAAPENSLGSSFETSHLSREEATAIALHHAGLTDVSFLRTDTDFDREKGITVYEVEFEWDGYEYDYVIHSQTGEILRAEKEADRD